MSDGPIDIDAVAVAGALATNFARDARTFLPVLAAVLEASLPDETVLERKGSLFARERPVRKVRVSAGDYVYEIEDSGSGRLVSTRTHVVRGIALKHEPLPINDWLTALSSEIARRAATNEQSYFALKNMLDFQ
ncbi:MAG: hypothetical protein ACLQVD_21245 [Capsulimonadaceae bacterium]